MGTLGYTTIGSFDESLGFTNRIHGSKFTTSDAPFIVESISAAIKVSVTSSKKIKCAIYNWDISGTMTFVAETEERTESWPTSYTWETFNFASPVTLLASTAYVFVIWAEADTGIKYYLANDPLSGYQYVNQNITYGSWPDPETFSTYSDAVFSIYATGYSLPGIPVYRLEFWSGSTKRYTFGSGTDNPTDYVSSISIRPGLTNTIGSFEIVLPDSDNLSNYGKYKDVLLFEDAYVWIGYNTTGSPLFKGKIESIKGDFSKDKGWQRTIIGRDYGECFDRILKRRSYTPDAYNIGTIIRDLRDTCTGSTFGGLSDSNDYMLNDVAFYTMALDNENVLNGIKEISDFSSKDFYVDPDKKLHWFERQVNTGSDVFEVGANIQEYTITKDISSVKNDIYVFGRSDPSEITGSYKPQDGDSWTELSYSNWSAKIISGSTTTSLSVGLSSQHASGSYSIYIGATLKSTAESANNAATIYLEKDIRTEIGEFLRLTSNDFFHFFVCGIDQNYATHIVFANPRIRLKQDETNYLECKFEEIDPDTGTYSWKERKLLTGPKNEGLSYTGSKGTTTGSYKWQKIGKPDWYKISTGSLVVDVSYPSADPATYQGLALHLDGLYFGVEFSANASGSSSILNYGYRPRVETNDKYCNATYCQNVADTILQTSSEPITQIKLSVIGNSDLQMGNRYLINIPAENISTYYELIDLEHRFDSNGFITNCTFSDRKEIRTIVPIADYSVTMVAQETIIWALIKRILGYSTTPYALP